MSKRKSLGTKIREVRDARDLSLFDVCAETRSRLPKSMQLNPMKLQRIEVGDTQEWRVHAHQVEAIAMALGVKTAQLSPEKAEELEQLRRLDDEAKGAYVISASQAA